MNENNQDIIKYIKQHKDEYAKDNIISQLKEKGYSDADIQQAIKVVYAEEKPKEKIQKRKDIAIGVAIGILTAGLSPFVIPIITFPFFYVSSSDILYWVYLMSLFAVFLLLVGYAFKKKRQFILIGFLIITVILPLLLFGGCFVLFSLG